MEKEKLPREGQMVTTIQESLDYFHEITEELNELAAFDQYEMYRRLIDLGNEITAIPEAEKVEENFVKGCVSQVYIGTYLQDGKIIFKGSSESQVVRGYVTILINALSGLSPKEILEKTEGPVAKFAEDTDLKAALTPSRTNAFGNIYQLMRSKTQLLLDAS
jgi:cysteine desulfuration protein SufE